MERTRTTIAATACLIWAALAGPALADDNKDCNSRVPATAITGCTALIDGGAVGGKSLAVAFKHRAEAYLRLRHRNMAIVDFNRAIDLDPELTGAYYMRGIAFRIGAQYERAVADFTSALALSGADADERPERHAETYRQRGEAYEGAGHRDLADDDYRQALRFDRSNRGAKLALDRLHGGACDRLTANPQDMQRRGKPVAYANLDAERAVIACQAELKADPGNGRLMLNLARAYTKAEDHENSLKWTRAAMKARYPYAFHAMFLHYLYGMGVDKDAGRQSHYLELGVKNGVGASAAELAFRELDKAGRGMDRAKAERLIKQAKEMGWDTTLALARLHHAVARQLLARRTPAVDPDARTETIVEALSAEELAAYRGDLAAARTLFARHLTDRDRSKDRKAYERIGLRLDVIDALTGKSDVVQGSAIESYDAQVRRKLDDFRFPAHLCREPLIPPIDANHAALEKFDATKKAFNACIRTGAGKDSDAFKALVRTLGGSFTVAGRARVPDTCKCKERLNAIGAVMGLRLASRNGGQAAIDRLINDYVEYRRSGSKAEQMAAYRRHNTAVLAVWDTLYSEIPRVSKAIEDTYSAHGLAFSPVIIRFLRYKIKD